MSELPCMRRATPGSNTSPGLFGVTPPMLFGPSSPPGFGAVPAGCVNARTWCTCARAGVNLDRLDPLVLGDAGRHAEVLVRNGAARRDDEIFSHREDRVRLADRPALGELRRRRQILVVALGRAGVHPRHDR